MSEIESVKKDAENIVTDIHADLLKAIHAEQQKTNALLAEFTDAVNKIGDMFNSPDGKPVSPMALISGALFGKK